MSVPNSREIETLVKELRMVANMINMCEKIQWGRETTLMDSAADMLITIHQELQKAREHELEVLAVHLDRQLAGFTSVSLDSVYRYIEERHKAIQSELDQPTV